MLLTTLHPESTTEVSPEKLAEFLASEYAAELDNPHPLSRYAWLAENVFDVTTYDNAVSDWFGRVILRVALAVTRRTTLDEMKDPMRGREYLIAVNLPFFADRLEWGGSIRGAWWDWKNHSFDVCFASVMVANTEMGSEEMERFWRALEQFAAVDDTVVSS